MIQLINITNNYHINYELSNPICQHSIKLKGEGITMKKIFIAIYSLLLLVGLTSCIDLQKAVSSGNLADVEAVLAKGVDVNMSLQA